MLQWSGSQLVSAKKLLEGSVHTPQRQLDINTKKVMEETARNNVIWKLAPDESQWRDGCSEQAVAAIKRTLKHLHQDKDLTFPELLTLMFRCMDIINNRPLGVRFNNGANPSYAPITPNALLKNSRTDYEELKFKDYDHINEKYVRRMKHVEKVYYDWWDLWKRDVLDSLFPFKKWKQAKQNVQVGDICFLMQDAKLGSPGYRLCKVTAVYPDASGLVRTVQVGMRPRDSRESSLPYKVKELWLTDVSVQRLVMVLPVAEQGQEMHTVASVSVVELGSSDNANWPLFFNDSDIVSYFDFYQN